VFAEIQVRRSDFTAIEQQTQLRDAITYRVSPDVQILAGYVWTHNGQYGDFPAARTYLEHRAYQQASVKQHLRRFEVEHRLRDEQRWIQDSTFWRYQNRFRYQFKANLPLRDPWFLFGGDEVLIHYGPNHGSTVFDQNRSFAGVGYRFTPRNPLCR
jgi:hypothetical protein